ncbi:MAG: hypothetical protein WCP14_04730 [bacterium]
MEDRQVPNFDQMGELAEDAWQDTEEKTNQKVSETNVSLVEMKENREKLERKLSFVGVALAGVIALGALPGCSAKKESSSDNRGSIETSQTVRQYTNEEMDEIASSSMKEAGASQSEIDLILKGEEYRDAIESLNRDPKDFVTWIEERRADAFEHSGTNGNQYTENAARGVRPDTIGYEAHRVTKPTKEEISESKNWLAQLTGKTERWKVEVRELVSGPRVETTILNSVDLYRYWEANRAVDNTVFDIAVDELNPGLLNRLFLDKDRKNTEPINVILPDLRNFEK